MIEGIQALANACKEDVKCKGQLLSIEYLETLENEITAFVKDVLNSFELGQGYLKQLN